MIAERLERDRDTLAAQFRTAGASTRYFVVDNLLPPDIAHRVYDAFPDTNAMRLLDSFREKKLTTKKLGDLDPIIADVTFAFQGPAVIERVEAITRLRRQLPDPSLYAGGISVMLRDHFLHPHLDNSHDSERQNYRTLNLLYYVTPNWTLDDGGHLELWDPRVRQRTVVPSSFNRLVVMETHLRSWHSVSRVRAERRRTCVSNYYFSPESPIGTPYFHVTSFSAPPDQPLRRAWARVDNTARYLLRCVFRRGIGRKDVFQATEKSHGRP